MADEESPIDLGFLSLPWEVQDEIMAHAAKPKYPCHNCGNEILISIFREKDGHCSVNCEKACTKRHSKRGATKKSSTRKKPV